MNARLITFASTILLLSACGMHIEKKTTAGKGTQGGADPVTGGTVSFQWVKANVLDASCVRCHSAGGKAADLPFTSYVEVMGTGTVKAGNAAASALFQAIDSGQMPPRQPRLADDLINNVAAWINQGAKN